MTSLAVSVFTGAFLLFQVQPLIVKFILPWFGGGPAVWSTAMVFFQVVLVGGYAYAHTVRLKLSPRAQAGSHLVLLLVAMAVLPIVPSEALKPHSANAPTMGVLLLLLVTVGFPYFVLASTSPLMQAWAVVTKGATRPYRLYALSNVGSLLALLSYPILFEPWLGRHTQALGWSLAFVGFAMASAWTAITVWRTNPTPNLSDASATREAVEPLTRLRRVLWVLLPAVASILLISVTNEISQDVAAMPFLWILPLSLYLLSFIIAFDKDRWYTRSMFLTALFPAIVGMVWALFRAGTVPLVPQIGLLSFGLFICSMVCHGELARLKPDPTRLTEYFLWIAIGGALGGIFVGLLAPLLFPVFLELQVGILMCVGLVFVVVLTDPSSKLYGGRPVPVWLVLAAVYVALSYTLNRQVALVFNGAVTMSRNFYGVLTIVRYDEGTPDERLTMRNGMIDHGMQFTAPDKTRLPVTYYSSQSGLGMMFRNFPRQTERRIGLVGLGAGVVATYARRGDTLRAYEINPQVSVLAREWFSYLDESLAEIQIVHGDARLSLEREPPQRFDILVLDAFSGDAIPVHLLTEEAFTIYERHLAVGGVIAIHLSNRHMDFTPVVRQHGEMLGRCC